MSIDLAVIKNLGGDHLDLPFWEGARRGELLLHRCGICGKHYWPASRCVEHGGTDMAWVPASGRGTVHTYTIMHHAYAPRMAPHVPYCVAVLKLEEGPFFHTNIVDCPMEGIHVGLEVAVRFEEDEVSGLTLPVFAPVA
ncbi:hypothetical protein FHS51_001222 [Sphingobium wenxiniae]|uniref:OB-fold protein n=1 Tax=Sphingobium wenxiniae (strain DSM 21828 / CGMCC 1.7748 / JZ-1) TaxID=595605 RepID=A0A562KEA0_SPHWJ|nr:MULTISPECIES: OB-fold domain-containing protein [Sphingobium]MBB6191002.1 hypothetical protein [Sphingobium wenxiniae]TWH93692.1 hypothetical protein IQ35_01901 [Sphingobium wenxiniae]WRD75594.1 OB-fold domain-containing protein [Sphingobium baderi]